MEVPIIQSWAIQVQMDGEDLALTDHSCVSLSQHGVSLAMSMATGPVQFSTLLVRPKSNGGPSSSLQIHFFWKGSQT